MAVNFSDEFKEHISKEHLEDVRDRIITMMTTRSVVQISPESAEFLMKTYDDKLAELYF